jgi:hypothetical protein
MFKHPKTVHHPDPLGRRILPAIIRSIRIGPVEAACPFSDVAGQVQSLLGRTG